MIERLFAKTEAGAFGEETTALYDYTYETAQEIYHRYECEGPVFSLRYWQNMDSNTFKHFIEVLNATYIQENFSRRAIFTFAMAGINEDFGFRGDFNRFFYGLLSALNPEPAFDVMNKNGYISFIPLFDVGRAAIPAMLKKLALDSNVQRITGDYPENTALYYQAASLLSFNTRADFVDPEGSSHDIQRIINKLEPLKIHESSPQIYEKNYNLFMSVLKRPETFPVSLFDVARYFLMDFDREYLKNDTLTRIRQKRLEEHLQTFVYGPGLQLILEGADPEKMEAGLRSVLEAIVEPMNLEVSEFQLIFRAVLINLYHPFPDLMASLNVENWEVQGHLSKAQQQLNESFACPFGGPLAALNYRFSDTVNVLVDGVVSRLQQQGYDICFDSVIEGLASTAVKGHLLKSAGGMTEKFQVMLANTTFDSETLNFNTLLNYINTDALAIPTQIDLAYHLLDYNKTTIQYWYGIFLATKNLPSMSIDPLIKKDQIRSGLITCLVERGQLTAAIQAYLGITGSELQATGGGVSPERWQSGLELDLGL